MQSFFEYINLSFFFVDFVVGQISMRHKKAVIIFVFDYFFVLVAFFRLTNALAFGLVFPLVVRVYFIVEKFLVTTKKIKGVFISFLV